MNATELQTRPVMGIYSMPITMPCSNEELIDQQADLEAIKRGALPLRETE